MQEKLEKENAPTENILPHCSMQQAHFPESCSVQVQCQMNVVTIQISFYHR